jgi:hypothetical protein
LEEKLTREHAWPSWTSQHIPQEGLNSWDMEFGTMEDGAVKVYDRLPKIDVITQTVCDPCHRGFLDAQEQWARRWLPPFISDIGHRATPNTGEVIHLSTWMVKTAMMLDLADALGDVVLTPAERLPFRQAERPTPAWVLWWGWYRGIQPGYRSTKRRVTVHDDRGQEQVRMYHATFRIGHLAFAAVANLRVGTPLNVALDALGWQRLWPPHADVQWPPEDPGLTKAQWDDFAWRGLEYRYRAC